ncbi:TRAP transporter small permease subunit [Microvirga sp. M2]|uniref:TRAP transporter small permease subunit n=1 Tax=Microvirga sp. M2 TaxID=3073270 RepID=UPI0039C3CD5E
MVLRFLDRGIGRVVSAGRWLVLPVMILLFLQWPLRDGIKAYSRQANDLGQWLFALMIAIAVTAATRARVHLAADAHARHYRPETRQRIARMGAALVLVPWAILILVAGWPMVWASLAGLEAFPETGNPGYFLIKLAVLLLAGLVLLQAVVTITAQGRFRS